MDRVFVAVVEFASVAYTVKVYVPLAVGVPWISAVDSHIVDSEKDNPGGRLPDKNDHVKGWIPSVAIIPVWYAVPRFPSGNESVVMLGRKAVVISINCSTVVPSESAT